MLKFSIQNFFSGKWRPRRRCRRVAQGFAARFRPSPKVDGSGSSRPEKSGKVTAIEILWQDSKFSRQNWQENEANSGISTKFFFRIFIFFFRLTVFKQWKIMMKSLYLHLNQSMLYLYRVEKPNFESCPRMKLSRRQQKLVSSIRTWKLKLRWNYDIAKFIAEPVN